MKVANRVHAMVITASAVLVVNGCAGPHTTADTKPQPLPATAAEAVNPIPAPVSAPILTGKVVETINAGAYTYLALEKDGVIGWSAVPTADVKVGQELQLKPGTEMGRFVSKSLNRTFDNIYFSAGIATGELESKKAADPMAGHAPMSGKKSGMAAMMGGGTASGMARISGKVVESMDSGGYTYINLENEGKNTWAAIPTTKVAVGQELQLQPGVAMPNFTSKSLNRTFDSVIFSGGLASTPAAADGAKATTGGHP